MLTRFNFSSIALASALLAATAVQADSGSLYTSGFYTGALLGYSSMKSSFTENVSVPGQINASTKVNGQNSGIVGTLLLGYRHFLTNQFMVGGELGFSADNNQVKKSFTMDGLNIETKVKGYYRFTPALVFGKQFSSAWLGFLKLGVSLARFTANNSLQYRAYSPTLNTFHASKVGFMGALGAEYAINRKLSGVGLVSWESFGSFKKSLPGEVLGVAGEQHSLEVKPQYLTFKMGVNYKF